MRTVAIIQARMGSTRLPGKVMMDVIGEPMLFHVVQRVSRARAIDQVVVATTEKSDDDAIVRLCESRSWPCFRGSEDDVLDRYYQAAREHRADVVVRITSDCPVIDPGLVDDVVSEFVRLLPDIDYASNTLDRQTYPRGLDTEVMRLDALEEAWRTAEEQPYREHVTLFIYRHPELFRLHGVYSAEDYSDRRWTVDTPEDLKLIRLIFDHFGDNTFSWRQILEVLEAHPHWQALNRHIVQKSV
jgi:spore coat polysaccharide biosynthesis protein SpsF